MSIPCLFSLRIENDKEKLKTKKKLKMLRCENYLTVVTNRSKNLIHFLSNPHVPTLEVQFRNPSQGPVIKMEFVQKV